MVPQISGRVANSPDGITVQEVPTGGTVVLFPSAGGKCIYSKRWAPGGNIATMRFVPEASEAQPKQPSQLDTAERIENRLPYGVEAKRSSAARRKAVKANAAE